MTKKEKESIWTYYEVVLEFLNKVYGGLPKDPKLIAGFLKGRGVSESDAKDLGGKILKEMNPEAMEKLDIEKVEAMWTGFKQDEVGPYIETRQIKAMLKEACGESEMWREVRGLKSRLGGALFPKGDGGPDLTRIYFVTYDKEGEPSTVKEVGGYDESVGHVKTMQGPRSILKRKDYIYQPRILFTLKVGGRTIKEKHLRDLFEFSSEGGLGADRSTEAGKFKVIKLEQVDKPE